jgi:hypothetical protein
MSEILDKLVADYDQKIQQEKDRLQQLELARSTSLRNIDRLEGAKLGVVEAQGQMLSTAGQAAECEMPQQDTEAQE